MATRIVNVPGGLRAGKTVANKIAAQVEKWYAAIDRPRRIPIIVCGGRDFTQREYAFRVLDELLPIVSHIHEGGAAGADNLARMWAVARGIKWTAHHAPWETHGKRAGIIRNVEMLRSLLATQRPDDAHSCLVVAFPGGRGTEHMTMIARRAGVQVYETGEDRMIHDDDIERGTPCVMTPPIGHWYEGSELQPIKCEVVDVHRFDDGRIDNIVVRSEHVDGDSASASFATADLVGGKTYVWYRRYKDHSLAPSVTGAWIPASEDLVIEEATDPEMPAHASARLSWRLDVGDRTPSSLRAKVSAIVAGKSVPSEHRDRADIGIVDQAGGSPNLHGVGVSHENRTRLRIRPR